VRVGEACEFTSITAVLPEQTGITSKSNQEFLLFR
jgi:hypothetical protein